MPNCTQDVDAAGEIPASESLTYAQWKFAKYVAIFYHQAKKDGNLAKYFALVNILYCDRWPEEGNGNTLAKVC